MAVETAMQSGDALALTGSHWVLGFVLIERGEYARARRAIQAGLDYAQHSGESHYLAKLLNLMGFVHLEAGDTEGALHWDALALETCRQPDIERNWEAECYTLLNLATDELGNGHILRAEEYRREVEAILPQAQMSRFRFLNRYYLLCAEVALARNEPEPALLAIKEAAELAQAKGVTKNVIKSLLLEGQALLLLKRPEEAARCLREAVALADEIDHNSLRWKSRLRLAQLYAILGRANADLFEQAQDLVNTIASHLDDDKMRTSFLSSPLVIELMANAKSALRSVVEEQPEAAQAVEFPAGLSAREVDVLRLVAQGATNRQIADTLMISVKTVNAHMTNILNKIGCDNRTAATTFALQHGLVK
jgi:DNA-binding CsgD family transcriptional regulator